MSLKIIKAGFLDTIQDNGRYGYQHLGINPGGAMDKFSASVANLLAGNNISNAVIELHFPASVFLFQQPALIALSGAGFSPCINGEDVPINRALLVNKNSILQFTKPVAGSRAYLAVSGGLKVNSFLGSSSTHLKAAWGGLDGGALKRNDEIHINETGLSSLINNKEFMVLPWKADADWEKNATGEVWVLPGNEWNCLSTEAQNVFTNNAFTISKQSDRMGYRLNNPPLAAIKNDELVSSGVDFGTVQLLPDGKLIVLMADHQTTGGYPRIAHVISAHYAKLAQMKAGDTIHFKFTSQPEAETLFIKQQQHLQQLKNACALKLKEYLHVA